VEIGTIIMMTCFLGFFWGGFIFTLIIAFRKETNKQQEKAQ